MAALASVAVSLPAIFLAAQFLLPVPAAWANPEERETGAAATTPVLPPVTVTGTFINPATGTSSIDRQAIEKLPAGNGSINDLLGLFPDVQLMEEARTPARAAEILPPVVSISGGKSFDNAFLIDGLRNSSLLDPAADNPFHLNDIPGHPQEVFPEAGLAEQITVYDSNVPARYGGFTGGVVAVETRDPKSKPAGLLFYRTTRDAWTEFHLEEGEEAPRFEKHHAGIEIDLPLGDSAGLLGSYRQLRSRIPMRHLGGSEVQERRLENIFVKGKGVAETGELTLTLLATPYTSENFLPDIRNSRFSLDGGGYQAHALYERFLPPGVLQLGGGYTWSENRRRAPADLRQWAAVGSHDWGRLTGSEVSYEGGMGDVERTQEGVQLQAAVILEPVRAGNWSHEVEAGLEYAFVRGTFDRQETTRSYLGARTDPDVVCGADDFACTDNEQYFSYRRIWEAGETTARIQLYDLYLEDRLGAGRFSVRPGLRLSYDDFMGNLNLAPRLAATFDLLGEGGTVLVGGWNRYYGRTLLTSKLREAQRPYRSETRGIQQFIPTDWVEAKESGTSLTRFSHLDTPYADEWTAGVDQALWTGRLSFKYVQRQNRDQFAREYGDRQPDGIRYYTLTNDGSSRHESVRLTWERNWRRHYLSLNVTWQESTASNESYNDLLEADGLTDLVWFEGRLIPRSELPRRDFNRPWMANLTWVGRLPYGFSLANVVRYRSGHRTIVQTREQRAIPDEAGRIDPLTGMPITEAAPVYEERKLDGGVVVDTKLSWQSGSQPDALFFLEVYNLFDSRLETGASEYVMEVGRQVWLGAEIRF